MTLPDFLETDDGGLILIVGHRIGLHHVVRMYVDGASVEAIAAEYPSLSLAQIHRVIAFYLENQGEADAYVAEHDSEIARQIEQGPVGPSLVELRQRLKNMAAIKAG